MVHQIVLDWLGDLDAIDWSRASVDSISVRAKRGGEHTGPNPTDRGKAGSKYHFLGDRQGVPLAVQLTAANVHDSKLLEPLVDAVRPIRRPTGEPGRPRKRPAKLHADKAYSSRSNRQALRRRGITPRIARRGIDSSQRLGRFRWVVERSQAWVVAFRKLAFAMTATPPQSSPPSTSPAPLSACGSKPMLRRMPTEITSNISAAEWARAAIVRRVASSSTTARADGPSTAQTRLSSIA
jgi:transposase